MAQGFVSVKADLREVEQFLTRLERRQIPFAASNAINTLLFGAQKAIRAQMQRDFDRPAPYTLRSTRVEKSTYKPGPRYLTGRVWIKDRLDAGKGTTPANFLLPNIVGGKRRMKRFETALRYAGLLPLGWRVVPGAGADLDAYGNMSKGQIVQILSWFKTFGRYEGDAGNLSERGRRRIQRGVRKRGQTAPVRGKTYFAVRPGDSKTRHLAPGIWAKESFGFGRDLAVGRDIRPIMLFVPTTRYQKGTFDFFGIQQRYILPRFRRELLKELSKAIATAAARGKL